MRGVNARIRGAQARRIAFTNAVDGVVHTNRSYQAFVNCRGRTSSQASASDNPYSQQHEVVRTVDSSSWLEKPAGRV